MTIEGGTAIVLTYVLVSMVERMKALVVAILLALTVPASAEDMNSANYLLPACKAFLARETTPPTLSGASSQGHCVGFVDGLVHAARSLIFVCVPQEATTGQAVAVVVKYIEARPERMHEPFGNLALEALTAAWPCKR
jgi:hypothetical protein